MATLDHPLIMTTFSSVTPYAIDNGVEGVLREQIRRHMFDIDERDAEGTGPRSYPASVIWPSEVQSVERFHIYASGCNGIRAR